MIKHFKFFLYSLLASQYIRLFVGYLRWFYFVKIKKNLKNLNEPTNSIQKTVSHNLIVFDKFPLSDFVMKRMDWIIRAVSAIEFLNNKSKFLIIGPRTESDILKLRSIFYESDIKAIDLISYSPLILLEDFHNMSFKNDEFDCIICGWTISYSNSPIEGLKEIIRCTKNYGLIAFGVEHFNHKSDYYTNKVVKDKRKINHYFNESNSRLNSIKDFNDLFKKANTKFKLIFNHDAPLKDKKYQKLIEINGLASSQVICVYQIIK